MGQPFRFGFILGRFQPVHAGHERMIDVALDVCERLLVVVGSAQLSGTERNPFPAAYRMELLRAVYGDRIQLMALNDYTHEGDHSHAWGNYLLDAVERFGRGQDWPELDLMVAGSDEERDHWFPAERLAHVGRLVIPRMKLPISATKLREAVIAGDEAFWQANANPAIHNEYAHIREKLLSQFHHKNKQE
ncbi:adenylyltransferase/cytidyltransferase family protein [Paenibacillus sp. MMS18-CY102]|uniref:adenylyltransferase/cytidyltransferase family protein n=1 Tax=Paenibacillus sp. MMS18-CY102 TaxID=2682849 RepID=UPI001365F787|nr:adenylyltransferase/cytidyltransferase family protein [Paenibacillus sp. MMS18-CY102]MWC27872.1 adenylyltransferase/cytidyltransferase family protein [Paenibacillus sp. MMS18-CY102]